MSDKLSNNATAFLGLLKENVPKHLSQELYTKIELAIHREDKKEPMQFRHSFAFLWDETPEGYEFWKNVQKINRKIYMHEMTREEYFAFFAKTEKYKG